MDPRAYFAGKKITVMGLGLLGRGVGDARYLASCGAELIVTDLKTKEQLAASLDQLKEFPNIAYRLGEHRVEDFVDRDMILKAAGVPDDSEQLVAARTAGIPIRMSADLFAELSGIPIIGVTGTRGKSTTTQMIYDILLRAGKKVLLGGNIRGVSTLSLLPEVTSDAIGLLELDSWQLQGFGENGVSPSLSVFTTFFPDHLNYYHNDLDAYLADKANIFLNQKPHDTLVLGEQCANLVRTKYADRIASKTVIAGLHDLPIEWQLQIPGDHNRYDAALALAAARELGIYDSVSKDALEAFKGVEGRLELIRSVGAVQYYNDTNSTTPDATVAALAAVGAPDHKNIILIWGGADKNLDMSQLLETLPKYTKYNLMLAGTGTEWVRDSVPGAQVYERLADALAAARAKAEPGDVILFSPAFASFGMFKNEYDRGDQFTALVKAL